MDLDCPGCGEPVYVPTTDGLASEGTEARCACGVVSQVQCEEVGECDCEEEDCLHAGQGYRAYDAFLVEVEDEEDRDTTAPEVQP